MKYNQNANRENPAPQMTKMLASAKYDFLRTHPHLGNNVILIGLGGSYAYGTNVPESDVDIRGIATRSARDILTGRDFEQVTSNATDTVVYSFDKIIKLLTACNPNTIEMLGLKPEHYLYLSPAGRALVENANLFLSKRAAYSFGGYALAQLNRLCNKAGRTAEVNENETRSLQKAIAALQRNSIAKNVTVETVGWGPMISAGSLFIDDFVRLAREVENVHSDYQKSTRNEKAASHGKLAKHQMHLVRLYLMADDILTRGQIVTFREKEHDFLMSIRNGKYLTAENQPTKEFMDMVRELEKGLKSASQHTDLPDKPDEEKIQDFVAEINAEVVHNALEQSRNNKDMEEFERE